MEVVARHLKNHATTMSAGIDRDLFGRSAFNRFYYAAFLNLKADLGAVITALPKTHAGIPDFLRTTVKKELAAGIAKARRADDQALMKACSQAKSAASELADLMEQGYVTRVVADYHPDALVNFSDSLNFMLNNVPVDYAQTWPHRARLFARNIVDAWRQINA